MNTIQNLRSNARACELLAKYFDVEVGEHFLEDWYHFSIPKNFDSFGAEGAGGRYLLLENGSIFFISSEGSAGVLVPTLCDFIDLITTAPYWQDILHFSNGGALSYML